MQKGGNHHGTAETRQDHRLDRALFAPRVKTLVREGRVLVDGRIAASAEDKCDP